MTPWSDSELEATVLAYFEYWMTPLSARPTKRSLYRALAGRFPGRVDGAFERKFQNISAILVARGHRHLPGLKPMPNIQLALRDHVLGYLRSNPTLWSKVRD